MRKLAEIMALVKRVPKNGWNDFHKYKFATEADILDAVRDAMAERQVVLVPDAVDGTSEPRGEKGEHVFTLKSRFTVKDGESGEELSFHMYGQGSDKLDKGAYKAATGAEKYAVLKLFMVSTGDDPENEEPRKGEPPPPAGLDSIRRHMPTPPPPKSDGRQRTHQNIVMGNFGRSKGMSLFDISDDDVSFYRNACKKTLADPSKERFHASEAQRLTIFDAELRFRGLPVE